MIAGIRMRVLVSSVARTEISIPVPSILGAAAPSASPLMRDPALRKRAAETPLRQVSFTPIKLANGRSDDSSVAMAKYHGSERCGNARMRLREASASKSALKCRKQIGRSQSRTGFF